MMHGPINIRFIPVSYVTCSGGSFAALTSDTEAKAQDSNVFANHHRKVWSFAFSQNLPANINNTGNVLIALTLRRVQVTKIAMKKQCILSILCVCLYSCFGNSACKMHMSYIVIHDLSGATIFC